jgi:translation elongation factor EF-Ts
VKDLREKTGAPMMECKKALMDKEVQGDISKAIDWLRAKGIAKASSQTNRISVEGLIGVLQRPSSGITLVEVNSETGSLPPTDPLPQPPPPSPAIDFVARNQDFQKFVGSVAASTNQLLGNGDFEVNRVLALEAVGPSAGAGPTSSEPITLQQILGDITTAIR